MLAIVESYPFLIAAGSGERGQYGRVDHSTGAVGRHRLGIGLQRIDPAAQPDRQHLFQLGQRPDRGFLDSSDGPVGGGP